MGKIELQKVSVPWEEKEGKLDWAAVKRKSILHYFLSFKKIGIKMEKIDLKSELQTVNIC